jgi:hypothetical protein
MSSSCVSPTGRSRRPVRVRGVGDQPRLPRQPHVSRRPAAVAGHLSSDHGHRPARQSQEKGTRAGRASGRKRVCDRTRDGDRSVVPAAGRRHAARACMANCGGNAERKLSALEQAAKLPALSPRSNAGDPPRGPCRSAILLCTRGRLRRERIRRRAEAAGIDAGERHRAGDGPRRFCRGVFARGTPCADGRVPRFGRVTTRSGRRYFTNTRSAKYAAGDTRGWKLAERAADWLPTPLAGTRPALLVSAV